nr:hypothetical protein [Anoxybacillus sp. B2M1]
MYERGMSISDMARKWGIDRKTVRKYIWTSVNRLDSQNRENYAI